MIKTLRSLPQFLLVAFWVFASMPLVSAAIMPPPWLLFADAGRPVWQSVMLALTYWVVPPLLCFTLLKRSFAFLPLFAAECALLAAHALTDLGSQPAEMLFVRLFLVGTVATIGLAFVTKDALYPLMQRRARWWRKAPRLNVNAGLRLDIEGTELSVVLENCSTTGLALSGEREPLMAAFGTRGKGVLVVAVHKRPDKEIRVPLELMWLREDGQLVLAGFRAVESEPMRALISTLMPRLGVDPVRTWIAQLWVRSGVQRSLVTLWVLAVGGSLGMPACGSGGKKKKDAGTEQGAEASPQGVVAHIQPDSGSSGGGFGGGGITPLGLPDTAAMSAPVAPVLTAPTASPYTSNDAPLMIVGTCATGSLIALSGDVEAGEVATATGSQTVACETGVFSFAVAKRTDGTYTFSLMARDAVSGKVSATTELTWTKMTAAPDSPTVLSPAATPFLSGDTTLAIAGGCVEGNVVTLAGDEAATVTCAQGSYAFAVTRTTDGPYKFSVTQADASGNTSAPAQVQWTRDTTIPETPTVASPALSLVSRESAVTLTGGCADGNVVTLAGDVAPADVTNPQGKLDQPCRGSAYAFTVAKATDDAFALTVTQTSPVNGRTSAPARVLWTRDTTPPAVPTRASPAAADLATGDSTLDLAGACETGATVTLAGDASAQATCDAAAYAFTVTKNADGAFDFSVMQTDPAGNASGAQAVHWTRDTAIPPSPTITAPVTTPVRSSTATLTISGGCANGATVTLAGNVTPAEITSPAGTPTQPCSGGAYAYTVAKATDGSFSFSLTQTSGVNGKSSPAVLVDWLRDTTAPEAPTIAAPAANPLTSGDTTIAISGACEPGATVTLAGADAGSAACATGTYSFNVTKSTDGTYDFAVAQADAMGNASGATTFQWERDTSVPSTPTITAPAASPHYSRTSSVTVSGVCSGSNVVTLDGDVQASDVTSPAGSLTTTCAGGAYSFTVAKSADGSYSLVVIQTSTASDQDSAQSAVLWVRDTAAPAMPTITAPSANPYMASGQLTISGACEAGASVSLDGDDTQATPCASGAYTLIVAKAADGTYNFQLAQTDQAGNRSVSRSLQWIRDSQVPPTPTLTTPGLTPYQSKTTSLTLAGACSPGMIVHLAGDVLASEVAAPAGRLDQTCQPNSTYSYTIGKGADGTYAFDVTQSNGTFTSGSARQTWTLDTTPPTVVLDSSPPASNVTGGATFTFHASEAGSTIECRRDTAAFAACTSPVTYATVTNGAHTFEARARDAAGNLGASATYAWSQEAYSTIALYHFDTATTNLANGAFYTGANKGDLTSTGTTSVTGKFAEGRSFASASSQFATTPHNAAQRTLAKTMTVETWVKPTSLPASGTYAYLVAKNGAAGNYGWWVAIKRQSGGYYLAFGGTSVGTTVPKIIKSSSCTFSTGTWTHVAVTYNMGSVRFYCNGVAKGSGTIGTAGVTQLFDTTAALTLGRDPNGSSYLNGVLDETRISQTLRWSTTFPVPTTAYTAD